MTRTLDPVADLARQAATVGGPQEVLTEEQIVGFVQEQLAARDLDGRSVCVIIPDATRSCPLPLLLTAVHGALAGRVSRLTALVALGTHSAMTEAQLARHLGHPAGEPAARYPGMTVPNPPWGDPEAFLFPGPIPRGGVGGPPEGRPAEGVDRRLNRGVGEPHGPAGVRPVFPHEVVGFSGG